MIETDFRKRLSGQYFKLALDALNSDKTIGPKAPGDGDVISWYSMVCKLGILHLTELLKDNALGPVEEFVMELTYKFPTAKFPNAMATYGQQLYEAHFRSAESHPLLNANIQLDLNLINMEFIHQWGGREIRIPKRQKVRDVRPRVRKALAEGVPMADIAKKIGISRATLYRIMKEKN